MENGDFQPIFQVMSWNHGKLKEPFKRNECLRYEVGRPTLLLAQKCSTAGLFFQHFRTICWLQKMYPT